MLFFQVYLVDGGQEDDKMSTAHDPDDMHDAIGDLSDLSSYDDSPRDINKHKPLPAITGTKNTTCTVLILDIVRTER